VMKMTSRVELRALKCPSSIVASKKVAVSALGRNG